MKLWIDAQLSPSIAKWLRDEFTADAHSVRTLGLRDAKDTVIFEAARVAGAVVMTKDADFVRLVQERGAPPQVVWITCGNTSNAAMRKVLKRLYPRVMRLIADGEPVIEIGDRRRSARGRRRGR